MSRLLLHVPWRCSLTPPVLTTRTGLQRASVPPEATSVLASQFVFPVLIQGLLPRQTCATMASASRRYVWKGTTADPKYEAIVDGKIPRNHKLAKVDEVKFQGWPHYGHDDNRPRAVAQLLKNRIRLTSARVYADGEIRYSRQKFNRAQK